MCAIVGGVTVPARTVSLGGSVSPVFRGSWVCRLQDGMWPTRRQDRRERPEDPLRRVEVVVAPVWRGAQPISTPGELRHLGERAGGGQTRGCAQAGTQFARYHGHPAV